MTTTYENVIEQIVQSVFSTMLNLDLFRAEASPGPDHESLFATVHIAGAWTGSVVLSLSPEVALHATAAMLGISESEVTEMCIRDRLKGPRGSWGSIASVRWRTAWKKFSTRCVTARSRPAPSS